MEENKIIKPVPYIEEKEEQFEVTFVEPGSAFSTYIFDKERDAKICAIEVKPLVLEAVELGLLDPEMVSKEEFIVEPLVTEEVDEYGFKKVTTEYYKGETVIQYFDEDGNEISEEERQHRIDVIEEKKREEEEKRRKEEERESQKIPAQVDYTAVMTNTLLPSELEAMEEE